MDFNLHINPSRTTTIEQQAVNIELPERLASVALGTKMAFSGLAGLFRHPLRSALKLFAGGYLLQRGVTGYCQLYAKIGKTSTEPVNINIRYTFTVNRNREDVYDFWRSLENLPLFMSHLENITVINHKRSHWEAKIRGVPMNVSWDAEIVQDEPGYFIGWQSIPGSAIENAGKVEFADAEGAEGTIVKVVISYLPPAGGLGTGVAKLLNPLFENMVRGDVLRFKQYIEELPEADEPELVVVVVEESNEG